MPRARMFKAIHAAQLVACIKKCPFDFVRRCLGLQITDA